MLGYRLIRESDLDKLFAELAAANRAYADLEAAQTVERATLHAENRSLFERLITKSEQAASRGAMFDLMASDVNVMRADLAAYRNRVTGVPQVVASIGKGETMQGLLDGAGADMFEDIGDDRASDLTKRGLIGDAEADERFPAAESMSLP